MTPNGMNEILESLPADVVKVSWVLLLSFFIGLEREEHKQREPTHAFGGVRAFPLIGLVSYALALISPGELFAWVAGFVVVGGLMLLSYHHRLSDESTVGITTEITALATYALAGLVQREHYWIATTVGVVSVLLLELKKGLEGLTKHVASAEVVTAAKFLVLAAVILPVVPDRELTSFHLNPFKVWLVVVAVSGVSFASYVAQRLLAPRGGVLLSAVLGGAYSSTITTVVLAKKAKKERLPSLFAGSILTASGVMYARLVLFLAFFNRALAARLVPAFVGLGVASVAIGWLVSRRRDAVKGEPTERGAAKNPLELRAAFLFGLVFVVVVVLTHLARAHLGKAGIYALATIMGVADVDPFILGLTQASPTVMPAQTAAAAIVIAAASNNVVKGVYAYAFADRATGVRSLGLLLGLAAIGLVPLAWV